MSFNVPQTGNLFVTAAKEYYKNKKTIAKINNEIKKGIDRIDMHIYMT